MLLTIGQAPAGASPGAEDAGPVALLLACHARIRDFGALARRIAGAVDAPASHVGDAARDLHRYHTLALPLHQADEDLTVRPRLEAAASAPEVRAALARMGDEHVALELVLAELCPLWATLRDDPTRLPELAPRLIAPTDALIALWDQHLAPEEALIFPALAAVLSPAENAAIAAEIRARRDAERAAGGFSL